MAYHWDIPPSATGALPRLKVATCQIAVTHDIAANLRQVLELIRAAAAARADVAHFPECALSGYGPAAWPDWADFDWPAVAAAVAAVRAFAPGAERQEIVAIDGVRCGLLVCLDWAFPELWADYAGKVELVFHSCVSDSAGRDRNQAHTVPPLMQAYAWLHQYAISVANSCRPAQDFPSFWVERSGHPGPRAAPDRAGLIVNALADDPEQDRFFAMVRRFRESAADGSLYAPHRSGMDAGA